MAKQTFTTGSVLTAAQMNNLQANDYNWSVDSKSASYVLVAADAGKRIEMNAAGSTTITVNTGLFTAGDMVYISNIGAGTCTITAGTATVNKSTNASLALGQYQSGMLYFVSASASIFYPFDIGAAAATTSKNFSLLGTGNCSGAGAATVTVSGISGMDQLYIMFNGVSSASASSNISLRINTDTAGNYDQYTFYLTANTSYAANNMDATSNLSNTSFILGRMGINAASGLWGHALISGCNTAGKKMISSFASGDTNTSGNMGYWAGGVWNNTATVTSISVVSGTGNLDLGTFLVFGAA